MNTKTFLSTLIITLFGTILSSAQSLQQGDQITNQASLVSGKPYLLYYVGNNYSCYVKASNSYNYFKVVYSDKDITEEAIYYFISDGEKWKIQSRNSSKYFPVPTKSTTFTPVDNIGSAGLWDLNFQSNSNNNIAPSCYNETTKTTYSLNRSKVGDNYYLHGWDEGTAAANQLKIYEIALSTTANSDFTNKEVNVSGVSETPTTGKWYVMKKNSNFFIDSSTDSYISSTSPRGSAADNAKYLVHLTDAGDGKYYVETGYGNYLFTGNITTRVSATKYSTSDLSEWTFYPVTLADPLRPTESEVYTIGGSGSWIFVPTGFGTYEYYLYNITEDQFAYPTGVFRTFAVPVIIESQGDGTYQILTKDGLTKVVSATSFTITKTTDATSAETTKLTNAKNKLVGYKATPVTEVTGITEVTLTTIDGVETVANHNDGWYAMRIHSDSNQPLYNGNFIYTRDSEKLVNGWKYPMSHGGDYYKHPTADDVLYYVRLWPVTRGTGSEAKTYYHCQVPTGKYVVNYLNNYPIIFNKPSSDFIIDKNNDGTFYIQSSGFRAEAKEDYIGMTEHRYSTSSTRLELFKVDPSAQGLTAWQVKFNEGADDVKLHCTRTDIHGPNAVYNRGYFFLPTGQTPNGEAGTTEFQIDGIGSVTADIDATNKIISVVYAPNVCFTDDNVTVVQGARTTGKGNTMQALLRIEVKPQAPCYPNQFTISLTGAEYIDKVQAYMTTADQLHADGETPVLLGTQATVADGSITIPVTSPTSHLIKTGVSNYLWITADIKNTAAESATVDAAITAIGYQNAKNVTNTCDVTSKGNPDGNMRIFLRQQYVWVSNENGNQAHYYRDPVILRNGDNLLAFCDYRYDNVLGLGKDYDGSDYGHRMDVVMYKSTDNGATWESPITVAAGTEATETVHASGYAGPAVAYVNGKIICLMAMGEDAYDSSTGLKHIAMSISSDGGASWSTTPKDIYDLINWNNVSHSSAYVTPGKGVTYSNGRVAFVVNVKTSATSKTYDYILYSDDEGGTWNVVSSLLYNDYEKEGKDGKLEIMNDQRLLVSVTRDIVSNPSSYGRGYNITTDDASGEGINTWDDSLDWGNNLNSYDCNNDVLYFSRSPEAPGIRDAIIHTATKKANGDLRLFASFDQAAASSWKEMFTITPYNAATSSMQKLSDGNLAIFFEDGSIGNNEKEGCYALNCVVISSLQIEAQMTDLYTAKVVTLGSSTVDLTKEDTSGNWAKKVKTNGGSGSGYANVVVSAEHYAFDFANAAGQRVLCFKPSVAGATDKITITAPEGYIIKSFTIGGYYNNSTETYTLSYGTTTTDFNTNSGDTRGTLTADNIYYKTATFDITSNGTTNSSYALIADLRVELAKEYSVSLHQVNEGQVGESYATLYVPFDLQQTDATTKAYYITEVTAGGKAILTETPDGGRKIAHGTAVVLINSEGATHVSFAVTSNLTQPIDESLNLLKGTLVPMELDMVSNKDHYSLGRRKVGENGEWVAGFYNTNRVITLGANRAYLIKPSSAAPSQGFDLSFDGDDTTFIDTIDRQNDEADTLQETPWFTLDGRELGAKPTVRGIYIVNGRKVVIK